MVALNFIALITDTQWDASMAITTVAKIDISKNNFNYKEHKNNAYKLVTLLLSTSFIMYLVLNKFYNVDFRIGMTYFGIEIYNFIIYPIYEIKTCYLQLEWSAFKTTSNKMVTSILRMIMSLLKTPFCTGIGQIVSATYQFITINTILKKQYKVKPDGTFIKIAYKN